MQGPSRVIVSRIERRLYPELVTVIERRWTAREFSRADGTIGLSEFVFHRNGEPVKEFRNTWATSCRRAGIGKKHFHDFRRTAARNMVRAGVPQTVAMSITGHKTVSMFNRYNITSQEDRRDALRRTAEDRATAPRTRHKVVQMNIDRAAGWEHGQKADTPAVKKKRPAVRLAFFLRIMVAGGI